VNISEAEGWSQQCAKYAILSNKNSLLGSVVLAISPINKTPVQYRLSTAAFTYQAKYHILKRSIFDVKTAWAPH
jgi:hypothetical protein